MLRRSTRGSRIPGAEIRKEVIVARGKRSPGRTGTSAELGPGGGRHRGAAPGLCAAGVAVFPRGLHVFPGGRAVGEGCGAGGSGRRARRPRGACRDEARGFGRTQGRAAGGLRTVPGGRGARRPTQTGPQCRSLFLQNLTLKRQQAK